MSDDQLEDLKQFIDSRISQTEMRFERKLDERVGGVETRLGARLEAVEQTLDLKIEALRTEMLDGFAGVGEAIDEINHRIDGHLATMRQRIA